MDLSRSHSTLNRAFTRLTLFEKQADYETSERVL